MSVDDLLTWDEKRLLFIQPVDFMRLLGEKKPLL
jgi:hypothetical protein